MSLSKSGYQTYSIGVTIYAGKNTTRTIALKVQSDKGSLFVTSTPSDAAVSIGGVVQGRTPLNVSFPIGQHPLSVSKSGYSTYDTSIVIQKGNTTMLNASLTPLPPPPVMNITNGSLYVVSSPSLAQFKVDNAFGMWTPFNISVAAGGHIVTVWKGNYSNYTASVAVEAGKTTTLNVTLTPTTG